MPLKAICDHFYIIFSILINPINFHIICKAAKLVIFMLSVNHGVSISKGKSRLEIKTKVCGSDTYFIA